jgi:hypothetical protein
MRMIGLAFKPARSPPEFIDEFIDPGISGR